MAISLQGTGTTDASQRRLVEWQAARSAVDRLDQTLSDLRKFSFSLITGFIAASAFATLIPTMTTATTVAAPTPVATTAPGPASTTLTVPSPPTTQSTTTTSAALPDAARGAVVIAIMVLVVAVFGVDRYYWVLQSGAVERAADLEQDLTFTPQNADQVQSPRLTQIISSNAARSMSGLTVLVLYLGLLSAAFGLGVGIVGPATIVAAVKDQNLSRLASIELWCLVVGAAVALVALIIRASGWRVPAWVQAHVIWWVPAVLVTAGCIGLIVAVGWVPTMVSADETAGQAIYAAFLACSGFIIAYYLWTAVATGAETPKRRTSVLPAIVLHQAAPARPGGYHLHGEFFWNSRPTAGQPIGWVRITNGADDEGWRALPNL